MNSTSKKLEYAKFLSTLEEEECRALTEEVAIILVFTCTSFFSICSNSSHLFQAILARSRSRERAAEAQQRRRLQRPKTRVVLSTSASKGSYRILQEEFSSLGNSLGRSYQRLGHQTELDGAQLQLRSYSYSTPEALQKTQEDGFLY